MNLSVRVRSSERLCASVASACRVQVEGSPVRVYRSVCVGPRPKTSGFVLAAVRVCRLLERLGVVRRQEK